jgi:hypothetical protein
LQAALLPSSAAWIAFGVAPAFPLFRLPHHAVRSDDIPLRFRHQLNR